MTFVHIHLAINHSPLYAELFAFALLLVGMIIRNRSVATSGLVIAIVAALCGVAAYLSGDEAADIISHSPPIAGVEKLAIGPHEEAADWVLIVAGITGALAILALFLGRKRPVRPRWIEVVVLVAIALSLATVVRTALLGGRIHHPEVRAVTR